MMTLRQQSNSHNIWVFYRLAVFSVILLYCIITVSIMLTMLKAAISAAFYVLVQMLWLMVATFLRTIIALW